MKILMNTGGVASTNCYVVADESTRQAVLFDAPDHTVEPLLDQVDKNGWSLIGLWLTHAHFDHIADHALVTSRFPQARVLIHPLEEPMLKHPGSTRFALPFDIPPRSADGYVQEGDLLSIGSLPVKVLHTPGHAPGHVMYHITTPTGSILIGGDLIIGGSVGRTDIPGSDHSELESSIRRIMKLPGATTLFPGHGDPSTLDDERANNPSVQQALGARI